jgi:hypothetical protein
MHFYLLNDFFDAGIGFHSIIVASQYVHLLSKGQRWFYCKRRYFCQQHFFLIPYHPLTAIKQQDGSDVTGLQSFISVTSMLSVLREWPKQKKAVLFRTACLL